ncbi:Myc-type, basic helix-loop-helix domain-containing protein [Sporodiniella umbellata]|nr:Myc-type, basic helix-loop-helix domain-containing protein [Sporodiniella umbellata]
MVLKRKRTESSEDVLMLGQSCMEKREQARKVSHSAIEKRRRERMNEKIVQLKALVPLCAEQENLHKISVLQGAIDYILYLKDMVQELDASALKQPGNLKYPSPRRMLPKEVEPFTSQFSIQRVIPLGPPQEASANMSLNRILC